MLWITDSSNQVAQSKSQAVSDKILHQSLQFYLIHRSKYKEAAKMGRQRNRPRMKEQENSPEELDEMEASNVSDKEYNI